MQKYLCSYALSPSAGETRRLRIMREALDDMQAPKVPQSEKAIGDWLLGHAIRHFWQGALWATTQLPYTAYIGQRKTMGATAFGKRLEGERSRQGDAAPA